jgi:hypothetical protein
MDSQGLDISMVLGLNGIILSTPFQTSIMPGKYTEGYTKNAQKTKFVRHRDIKMKDGELKRERHIQKAMCEGICRRCREKVQWRFRYDKYKPLTKPANCQECKQKTVTKAYRTLCDGCAVRKNACPSCCVDMDQAAALDEQLKKEGKLSAGGEGGVEDDMEVGMGIEEENSKVLSDDVAMKEDGAAEQEVAGEGEGEEEGEEEMEEKEIILDISWNEKKFANIAASKYSKSRVTGDESDIRYN